MGDFSSVDYGRENSLDSPRIDNSWFMLISGGTWLVTNRPIHIDSDGHDDEKLGGAASAASEQTDLSS